MNTNNTTDDKNKNGEKKFFNGMAEMMENCCLDSSNGTNCQGKIEAIMKQFCDKKSADKQS